VLRIFGHLRVCGESRFSKKKLEYWVLNNLHIGLLEKLWYWVFWKTFGKCCLDGVYLVWDFAMIGFLKTNLHLE
jgi:hypothetical protein